MAEQIPPQSDQAMADGSTRVKIYIFAILILCFLVTAFVLGITVARPDVDNTNLITTVVGLFTPIVAALVAGALKENHDAVNNRLSQLLTLTEKASRAEGKLDGGQLEERVNANTSGLEVLRKGNDEAPKAPAIAEVLESIDENTEATAKGVKNLSKVPPPNKGR